MTTNNTWKKYSSKECRPYNRPSKEELLKYKEKYKEGWYQSVNPWCISCHNAYKEICEEVAIQFNLSYDKIEHFWAEKDLINMVNKIYNETKRDDYKTWLIEHEPKLESIINCINSRYFHHSHCNMAIKNNNRISTVTEKGHMRNLTTLCSSLLKLYILYEKNLKEYNDKCKIKKRNILLDLNTECANNCRNALKGLEIKNIFKDLKLKNRDINTLETKSPKSYNSSRRSKRKSSYKVKNNKMKSMVRRIS